MHAHRERAKKKTKELDLSALNPYIICMWHFTKHVQERLIERGYTRDELIMVLEGEVPSFTYPSPKEETVDLYFGKVGDKFLMIPVDRTTLSVITVRAMRKNEKEIYLKEASNG